MLVRILFVCLLVSFSTGCAFKNNPIPLGDSELVGHWSHDSEQTLEGGVLLTRMTLDITQEGYISYHFLSCFTSDEGADKSKLLHLLSMPIIRVTTKKIKAQTFPLTPKWEFKINDWPQQRNDQWVMTVDNIELNKVAEEVATDGWKCEG